MIRLNPKKRSKVNVTPGKSIEVKDLDDPETADPQSGPSGVQSKPKRSGNSHEKTKERPKKKAKLDPTDSSTEKNIRLFPPRK